MFHCDFGPESDRDSHSCPLLRAWGGDELPQGYGGTHTRRAQQGAGHPGAVTRRCAAPTRFPLLGEGLPSARGSARSQDGSNLLYQPGSLSARHQGAGRGVPVVSSCVGAAWEGVTAVTRWCPALVGMAIWCEVAFNHLLKCSGDQSQCRSLIRDGGAQSAGTQGCSSPSNRRLKLSPWLLPSLLALGAAGDPWGHPEQEGTCR